MQKLIEQVKEIQRGIAEKSLHVGPGASSHLSVAYTELEIALRELYKAKGEETVYKAGRAV